MAKVAKHFDRIEIKTTGHLASRLGVPLAVLEDLAAHSDLHYDKFDKQVGKKVRTLYMADASLTRIHKLIQKHLLDTFNYPLSLQGGIKQRSLSTNASPHTGKKNVGRFDIKNFFPSVRPKRVYNTFVALGCAPDVARMLTRLVTADNHIPQGFKTSPKIAALVLLSADRRLRPFLKKYGIRESVWVDDFILSGDYPIKKLAPAVRKIFQQEGFVSHKEDVMYANQRQIVTGAVVNAKVGVLKEMRKLVMAIVHGSEKFGVKEYYKHSVKEKTSLRKFIQQVDGQLSHMMALDKAKYTPLQARWRKATENFRHMV